MTPSRTFVLDSSRVPSMGTWSTLICIMPTPSRGYRSTSEPLEPRSEWDLPDTSCRQQPSALGTRAIDRRRSPVPKSLIYQQRASTSCPPRALRWTLRLSPVQDVVVQVCSVADDGTVKKLSAWHSCSGIQGVSPRDAASALEASDPCGFLLRTFVVPVFCHTPRPHRCCTGGCGRVLVVTIPSRHTRRLSEVVVFSPDNPGWGQSGDSSLRAVIKRRLPDLKDTGQGQRPLLELPTTRSGSRPDVDTGSSPPHANCTARPPLPSPTPLGSPETRGPFVIRGVRDLSLINLEEVLLLVEPFLEVRVPMP